LKNPGVIEAGQKLNLPKIETELTSASTIDKENTDNKITSEKEYVVAKGDNLWKICVENYGDGYKWTEVWQENRSKIYNPSGLEIGMKITLPVIN